MRRKLPVLTKKIIFNIVIAGFILCTLIFLAGFAAYSRQFRTTYDKNIRSVAATVVECLNPDSFQTYLETKTPDADYERINDILQYFIEQFDLNLIYVSSVEPPDYKRITYIYNPVKKGGKHSPFPLGFYEEYEEPDYNSSAKKVFENGETVVRHTLKTRSGSHITAMLPVRNSQGKIIAVLGAQKDIQEFVSARHKYINAVILVEFIFAILFIIFFSGFFNLHFIKPVVTITRETDHFASYGGEPSEELMKIHPKDELGVLAHSVHQMECDVNRNIKQITQMTLEQQRLATELDLATKIQRGVLPKGYPAFPDCKAFDLFASMDPAKEVGGDLYDYHMLDDDHLMITVGDVSGKGIPAALFMMIVKTLLATHAKQGLSPAKIFENTNSQLCKNNVMDMFVTCWLGIITLSTKELCYVNAGHPFPVILRNGSANFIDSKPNLMLAGMDGIPYQEYKIKLQQGDSLLVYTDGVTEATDKNEQLFGEPRLLEALRNCDDLDAPLLIKKVRATINLFVGDAEQFDDITMLALKLV
ncbi:MAG: serine/threonine-protein phosphatase [Treponema sp.]|nr:serine/threonine-protein phosphatase [Treponema sp.]